MHFNFFTFVTFLLAAVTFAAPAAISTNSNYIVVLKPNSSSGVLATLVQTILGIVLDPLKQFTAGSFSGFTTTLSPVQLALLKADPNVSYPSIRYTQHRVFESLKISHPVSFTDQTRLPMLNQMESFTRSEIFR